MIGHPNSLLVHQCLQAANDGDRETLRALWADDIVWHVKGASPWRGEIKGPDDIFDYLANLGEIGAAGVHTEIEDVLISSERAAVICRTQARRGDRILDASFLMVARIISRRIQEIVSVPMEPDRLADFWAE